MRSIRWLLPLFILSLSLACQEQTIGIAAATAASPDVELVAAVSTEGMVSSAHPLASQAGAEVLKAGGNAFDAATAVAFTLGVVEPMNSGLGGYGAAVMLHAESNTLRALDFGGRLPETLDASVFRKANPNWEKNRIGAAGIFVPTTVNAWYLMHKTYGSKPWKDLLQSAIRHAEQGHLWQYETSEEQFQEFPEHARAIYGKDGKPIAKGERIIQKELAQTLRGISDEGPDFFYKDAVAEATEAEVAKRGGFLAVSDMAANFAEWLDPLTVSFRGYEVTMPPPPQNSFDGMLKLKMMEHYDLQSMGHNSAEYLHLFIEAQKISDWHRLKYAGDPGFVEVPIELMFSEDYLDELVAKIDLTKSSPYEPPKPDAPAGEDTTHYVVADKYGNVVSMTQTLGYGYGSKVMVPGYGFWLNNSAAFATFDPPGGRMDVAPGKRKSAFVSPSIITRDGNFWAAIGTPGGGGIVQTVPQMILNLIEFEMDVQEAISAPRIRWRSPDSVMIEGRIPEEVAKALEAKGHSIQMIEDIARSVGNAHGIRFDRATGTFYGASDPRGIGAALGN